MCMCSGGGGAPAQASTAVAAAGGTGALWGQHTVAVDTTPTLMAASPVPLGSPTAAMEVGASNLAIIVLVSIIFGLFLKQSRIL